MASNADTVGRLLATSTLMKGERELLRKQDEPAPEAIWDRPVAPPEPPKRRKPVRKAARRKTPKTTKPMPDKRGMDL